MVEAARVDLRPRGQQRGRRVAAAHVTRPQERGPGAGVLGLNLVTDIVDIYVDTDEGLYMSQMLYAGQSDREDVTFLVTSSSCVTLFLPLLYIHRKCSGKSIVIEQKPFEFQYSFLHE